MCYSFKACDLTHLDLELNFKIQYNYKITYYIYSHIAQFATKHLWRTNHFETLSYHKAARTHTTLYNLLSDDFTDPICNMFAFFRILFSLLLLLQWPHLQQWDCKRSVGLHRKRSWFMPRMFPRVYNSIKVQMRSLILFSFLLCAIKPAGIPYSGRTCKRPWCAWPTSSNTLGLFFPHSHHRRSAGFAPAELLQQVCDAADLHSAWLQRKTLNVNERQIFVTKRYEIFFKTFTSLYMLQNWPRISRKTETGIDLRQLRNNHRKAFQIQPSMK